MNPVRAARHQLGSSIALTVMCVATSLAGLLSRADAADAPLWSSRQSDSWTSNSPYVVIPPNAVKPVKPATGQEPSAGESDTKPGDTKPLPPSGAFNRAAPPARDWPPAEPAQADRMAPYATEPFEPNRRGGYPPAPRWDEERNDERAFSGRRPPPETRDEGYSPPAVSRGPFGAPPPGGRGGYPARAGYPPRYGEEDYYGPEPDEAGLPPGRPHGYGGYGPPGSRGQRYGEAPTYDAPPPEGYGDTPPRYRSRPHPPYDEVREAPGHPGQAANSPYRPPEEGGAPSHEEFGGYPPGRAMRGGYGPSASGEPERGYPPPQDRYAPQRERPPYGVAPRPYDDEEARERPSHRPWGSPYSVGYPPGDGYPSPEGYPPRDGYSYREPTQGGAVRYPDAATGYPQQPIAPGVGAVTTQPPGAADNALAHPDEAVGVAPASQNRVEKPLPTGQVAPGEKQQEAGGVGVHSTPSVRQEIPSPSPQPKMVEKGGANELSEAVDAKNASGQQGKK